MSVHGLLLAAGAGSRMGQPKALVREPSGEAWLTRSARVLVEGGCDDVTVVLGAAAEEARLLLEGLSVRIVVAHDWESGQAASLRAGLAGLPADATAAVVHLVDLPDIGPAVVDRVIERVIGGGRPATSALARAVFAGAPGHPVLIGREHWAGVCESADGDQGARGYLAAHDTALVECGDLAGGLDVDRR